MRLYAHSYFLTCRPMVRLYVVQCVTYGSYWKVCKTNLYRILQWCNSV